LEDLTRVGDGRVGTSSSSESSEFNNVGCHLASAPAAAAKMLRFELGALVPPLRRGDSESDAIEIGDGSAISISIGVPCPCPANIVCARPNGVLVLFLRTLVGSGDSIDKSVSSVEDGKSDSPFVLTDDNGMSFALAEFEKSLSETPLAVLDRFCNSTSTLSLTS
jgi:hypothetical protein